MRSAPASACCSATGASAKRWRRSMIWCVRPCAWAGTTGGQPMPRPFWGRPRQSPGTTASNLPGPCPARDFWKASLSACCPPGAAYACWERKTRKPCAACIWMIWCWTNRQTCPARYGRRCCAPCWPTVRDARFSAARLKARTTCSMTYGSRQARTKKASGRASAFPPQKPATCRSRSWQRRAGAWTRPSIFRNSNVLLQRRCAVRTTRHCWIQQNAKGVSAPCPTRLSFPCIQPGIWAWMTPRPSGFFRWSHQAAGASSTITKLPARGWRTMRRCWPPRPALLKQQQ